MNGEWVNDEGRDFVGKCDKYCWFSGIYGPLLFLSVSDERFENGGGTKVWGEIKLDDLGNIGRTVFK